MSNKNLRPVKVNSNHKFRTNNHNKRIKISGFLQMVEEERSASYHKVMKRVSNFRSWSVSNGIQIFDSIRIDARWDDVNKRYSLCIVSTGHLRCFQKLLAIPITLCLGARTCSISKELIAVGLGGGLALNFSIAQELALGPDSYWFDYLSILPSRGEQSLPMFWSEQERMYLKGTSLYSLITMDDQSLADDFELGFGLLRKFPNFKSGYINLALYKIAVSIASSRAFYIDEYFGECLIPWADIFNHSTHQTHVKPYCSKSSERNAFDMDSSEIIMQSVCSVRKHRELFNTFGLQSNSSLLHKYGFCEFNNKNGFVSIHVPFRKLKRDKNLGAWSEMYEIYSDGRIEHDLVIFIGYHVSTYRSYAFSNKKEFILECVSSAKSIFYEQLSKFEIADEENIEMRNIKARSGHGLLGAAAANMLRNEEIRILKSAIQMVERKGDKLWGKYYRKFDELQMQ